MGANAPSLDLNVLLARLKEQGFRVERTGRGHWKAVPPDPARRLVHFSRLQEPCAFRNTIAHLRQSGFVWEETPRSTRTALALVRGAADAADETSPAVPALPRAPGSGVASLSAASALEDDEAFAEYQSPPRTFGEALARLRAADGATQATVADLVEVTPSAVQQWEADAAVPIAVHYDALLDLFPALADGPVPDARSMQKPGPVAGTKEKDTPMALSHVESNEGFPAAQLESSPASPNARTQMVAMVTLAIRARTAPGTAPVIALLRSAHAHGFTLADALALLEDA